MVFKENLSERRIMEESVFVSSEEGAWTLESPRGRVVQRSDKHVIGHCRQQLDKIRLDCTRNCHFDSHLLILPTYLTSQ